MSQGLWEEEAFSGPCMGEEAAVAIVPVEIQGLQGGGLGTHTLSGPQFPNL